MQSGEQKTRILLVEDERKLARSLERQLTRLGYEVELAFDGVERRDVMMDVLKRTVKCGDREITLAP